MKILAFDTETGGLDAKDASLLTAYFEVLDSNFNTLDKLSLKVMPDDGIIKANPQALAINKIDIEQHKKEAITYSEARKQLTALLSKHSSKYDKLTPLAHNIDFDLGFVYEHLMPKQSWELYNSYRKLDTANLANFFKLVGWFPKDQKMALGDLAKSLEVEFNGDAHTADADVGVMIQILKTFVMSLRD
jgi:DNA polymerase III alpha subunit (gram-positive type)